FDMVAMSRGIAHGMRLRARQIRIGRKALFRQPARTQHRTDSHEKAYHACRDTSEWALIHSRCNLLEKGEPNLLKLPGVQTFSVASSMTLYSAAPPDRILTRSPQVTSCLGRDLAPRLNQSLIKYNATTVLDMAVSPRTSGFEIKSQNRVLMRHPSGLQVEIRGDGSIIFGRLSDPGARMVHGRSQKRQRAAHDFNFVLLAQT